MNSGTDGHDRSPKNGTRAAELSILAEASERIAVRRKKRLRAGIIAFFSCIIVFATAYVFILPAVTDSTVITCGKQEHTHTDDCYSVERTLICTKSAVIKHKHTDECRSTEKVLVCTEAESPGHTHTDGCFDGDGNLICTEQESAGHTHAEACYEIKTVYTCGYKEGEEVASPGGHVHTETCYNTEKTLICTKEEHTHSAACYSDPESDLESSSSWEASVKGVKLTGNCREDLVAIAFSQVGYSESSRNYVLSESGSKLGYTRYGAWYGAPYSHWCAMFVSFCLHYAGLDSYPANASCSRWVNTLSSEEYGLYKKASEYTPEPGDLVFFNVDTDSAADHIGIVTDVDFDGDGNAVRIHTVEGNRGPKVAEFKYRPDDVQILGYGMLETDTLPDPAEITEEAEKAEPVYVHSLSCRGTDYTIKVSYSDAANIPENTKLQVKEIPAGSELYEKYISEAAEAMALGDSKETFSFARFFDVSFISAGKEIEPAVPVLIEVLYDEEIDNSEGYTPNAIHFAESGDIEILDGNATASSGSTNSFDSFSYMQTGFSVTGTLLAASGGDDYTLLKGTFGKLCTSAEDFDPEDRYIIVSAQGFKAFCGDSSGTSVQLSPVNGNKGWYSVPEGFQDAYSWKFSPSDKDSFQLILQDETKKYMRLRSGSGYEALLAATPGSYTKLRLLPVPGRNTWKISGVSASTVYLVNGINGFSRGTAEQAAEVFIFKEVSATLKIPVEITDNTSAGSKPVPKPQYGAYTSVSAEKTGDAGKVSASTGKYFSDPSTSDIERLFTSDTLQDGLILTDKSVIYAGDDYNAISGYEENTFGVTLSVLAQDYELSGSVSDEFPSDYVFALDVSATVFADDNRLNQLADAVNSALEKIYALHPGNRAGIVIYSSGSWDLLELGRYYVSSKTYDPYSPQQYLVTDSTGLLTSKQLRTSEGKIYKRKTDFFQGNGAYIQSGIARATEMFLRQTDTVWTSSDGENTLTQTRRPVLILIADAAPDFCAPDYMNVFGGLTYGCDVHPTDSRTVDSGICGYYTVLTANHCKQQISFHYKNPSLFYTVGTAEELFTDDPEARRTDDKYIKAVLDPGNAKKDDKATGSYLHGSSNGKSVTVGSTDSYSQLGKTLTEIPFLDIKNTPYKGNFDYANSTSYCYEAQLSDVLGTLVSDSGAAGKRGLVFGGRTPLEITDVTGKGMQPLGAPVLRFGGRNYSYTSSSQSGNTWTYVYNYVYRANDGSGFTADLSRITVNFSLISSSGRWKIRFYIPDGVMPVYNANEVSDFYYEALPVRLIYKVGLTEEAKKQTAALGSGETLTFYASDPEGEQPRATFLPGADDPFYAFYYEPEARAKTGNATGTVENSFSSRSEVSDDGTLKLIHAYGNNGKLVFEGTDRSFDITVMGQWTDAIAEEKRGELTVGLYKLAKNSSYALSVSDKNGEPLTVTLNAGNNWSATFSQTGLPEEGFTYYIAETDGWAHNAQYFDGKEPVRASLMLADGSSVPAGEIVLSGKNKIIRILNGEYYELTYIGGPGTKFYTFAGTVFTVFPLMYGCFIISRRRERRARG